MRQMNHTPRLDHTCKRKLLCENFYYAVYGAKALQDIHSICNYYGHCTKLY